MKKLAFILLFSLFLSPAQITHAEWVNVSRVTG